MHPEDGVDLLWIGYDASVADDEAKQLACWYPEDAFVRVELPVELSEAVEDLFEVSEEVVGVLGLDDHVVDIGFHALPPVLGETRLDGSLVCRSGVIQPE